MNDIKDEINKDKKKVRSPLVIVIAILLSGLFGVLGWYLGTRMVDIVENNDKNEIKEQVDKEDKEETEIGVPEDEITDDEEESEVEDEEKEEFIPDEVSVSTITEEFKMNGYKDGTVLNSNYEITKRKVLNNDEEEVYVYALYREVYMNEKIVAEKHMLNVYEDFNKAKDAIDTYSIKDYKTIKDSKNDDSYLIIEVDMNNPIYNNYLTYWNSNYALTYILNGNGEILTEIKSVYAGTGVIGVYVTEQEAKDRYYVIASDEDDVMFDHLDKSHKYVLYPKNRIIDLYDKHLYYFTYQDGEDCSSSEHKIVIENGKLIDTKVRTFDESLVSSAGQTC